MSDFREFALCRDIDPELFFPVGAPGFPIHDHQVAEARSVCAVCPVRAECLAFALDAGIEFGVFGGFDLEHERRALPVRVRAA